MAEQPAIDLLYFARVREAIGRSMETVSVPAHVLTVGDLISWLATRGGGYAEAFADPSQIRAAIGDLFAELSAPLGDAREIALFPPVTGG